jgi:outer membrane biogenesis lipoprotein LolB
MAANHSWRQTMKTLLLILLLSTSATFAFANTAHYELKVWQSNNQNLKSIGKYATLGQCRTALAEFRKANSGWAGGCFNI